MNERYDNNFCYVIVKRPCHNNNHCNFPPEMRFENDYDRFEDNYQDYDDRYEENDWKDERKYHCNQRRERCHENKNKCNNRRCCFFSFFRCC